MRGDVPAYDLKRVTSLDEVFQLLAQGYQPFAGGTDLMVVFETGKLTHTKYVSVLGLPELSGIQVDNDHVYVGALTTYSEVIDKLGEFPSLVTAARLTGARAIQNRGTLGGNIANASPAADSPPALLAYDAAIELRSAQGERWVPYAEFHTGYKQTVMRPGELISRIRLPRRPLKHYYRKVGTRRAQAISKVCVAAAYSDDLSHVRIALGSVGPVTLRATRTEIALKNGIAAAQAALAQDISPMDDIRSTRAYRLRVAQNLIEECFGAVVPR